MVWCLVKHRDSFTLTFTLPQWTEKMDSLERGISRCITAQLTSSERLHSDVDNEVKVLQLLLKYCRGESKVTLKLSLCLTMYHAVKT
jgi:hypothetical protein